MCTRAGAGTMGFKVITLTLAIAPSLSAQNAPNPELIPSRVALSGGVGMGTLDFGGLASISMGDGRGDVILRMAQTTEFGILTSFPESVRDFALLYGRRIDLSRGWLRGALGPGHVRMVRRGEAAPCWLFCSYERISSYGFGLAVQAEAVWAPWKAFGLGVSAFGNLNPEASFGGLTVGVYVGVLR